MRRKFTSSKEIIFDEDIFDKFKRAKVSILSNIKPDLLCLTKIKEDFLQGNITAPILSYKKNIKINYSEVEESLKNLFCEVESSLRIPDIIREQYLLAINEKFLKLNLLRQTQALALEGDTVLAMQKFENFSKALYGTIDPDIFRGVLQIIEKNVHKKVMSTDLNVLQQAAVSRLQNLIQIYKLANPKFTSLPVKPGIQRSHDIFITDAEELKKMFENALKAYEITDDWRIVIDQKGTRSNISVSYNLQKIYLPSTRQLVNRSTRKKLTPTKIEALIAHEIGTHIVRYSNGRKSRLKLLGLGLSQYEQGEEGLATYREQCVQPTAGYAGLEAYFAIGLAKGFDGGPPRNFQQVYEVLTDYYFLHESSSLVHAKHIAWNRCVRIFRGTSGVVPGVVFTKDLIYRHGNIRHREAVKNGTISDIDVDGGKFDPTNNHHVDFLQKLNDL